MTIENVYKDNLCTGCGTCVAVCPTKAIRLVKDGTKGVYKPQIIKNRCNNCGLCLKVCPGWKVKINNKLLGNYLEIYNGRSLDNNLRNRSSSGGTITQILVSLLENKQISGALVTTMDGLESKPIIARTRRDIISAHGSKYCPTHTNILLRAIIESKK